ncbi:MAG: superinfection immunity protein [Alphaproteobacteria bacterium]|jgi:hypothetical protein|nr:superinfection immunity protein [Alphaproteobacteria bacterium]
MEILLIIIVVFSVFIYFIPWVCAVLREHPQKVAIFILNLFLGWTFLGWVVALIWAFIVVQKPTKSTRSLPEGP